MKNQAEAALQLLLDASKREARMEVMRELVVLMRGLSSMDASKEVINRVLGDWVDFNATKVVRAARLDASLAVSVLNKQGGGEA